LAGEVVLLLFIFFICVVELICVVVVDELVVEMGLLFGLSLIVLVEFVLFFWNEMLRDYC